MRIKSSVMVEVQVSCDAEQLPDGTVYISRPQLVSERGESGADFSCLPEAMRKSAIAALAHDAKGYITDMETVAMLGVVKSA